MSITVPSTLRRWLVPAAAALAVIGGGVAVGLATAAADRTTVQPRSAQDLIADLLTAHPGGLQGTVTVRVDLGLPPLPVPSAGTADLGSLAAGAHTLRVWYASPDHARVALRGRNSETDIVTNGTDLWVWSSTESTAWHSTLPDDGGLLDLFGQGGLAALLGGGPGGLDGSGGPDRSGLPGGPGLDPQAIGRLLIAMLQPSTEITTDHTATVAGRAAHELRLSPRDTASLIEAVVVDIDAEHKVPLRLAVLARDGGAPAIEIAFTEISFERPDESQFTFTPPPGTTVVEEDDLPEGEAPTRPGPQRDPSEHGERGDEGPEVELVGDLGWTAVLMLTLPDGVDPLAQLRDGPGAGLGEALEHLPTVSGDWGSGRLLTSRLVSMLITDDGRVLIGAVSPQRLYEAAA